MSDVGYVAALALAAVFVLAAVAKLAAPEQTADALTALGLPSAPAMARAVPAAELVTAALLVGWPWAGASLALGLLSGFTVVLFRAVRAGTEAGCGCFGGAGSDPIGPADLARNALLGALALAALAASRPVWPDPWAVVAVAAAVLTGGLAVRRVRAPSQREVG